MKAGILGARGEVVVPAAVVHFPRMTPLDILADLLGLPPGTIRGVHCSDRTTLVLAQAMRAHVQGRRNTCERYAAPSEPVP